MMVPNFFEHFSSLEPRKRRIDQKHAHSFWGANISVRDSANQNCISNKTICDEN